MGDDCCLRRLGCCNRRCPCVAVVAAVLNLMAVACFAVGVMYIKEKLEGLFDAEFVVIAIAAICGSMGVYDIWVIIASLCLVNGGCFCFACCECFCVVRNLVTGFFLTIVWVVLFGISVLVCLTFWTVDRLCITETPTDVCNHLSKSGFRNFTTSQCDDMKLCSKTDVSFISGIAVGVGAFASSITLVMIAMAFSANYVYWRNDIDDSEPAGEYEMIYKSKTNRYDIDARDSPAFSTNRKV